MSSNYQTRTTATLAATVAPEDLRAGSFVAVLHEFIELPSFFWRDSLPGDPREFVRLRCIPSGAGLPLKVKAVCLPFVFVKSPHGQYDTLDVRRVQLVRLDSSYAQEVWKSLRKGRNSAEVSVTPP